tara:strand:- start:2940 stop:3563 length:624 start_codon:yes stop_codon:yes gene_type:complete
MILSHRKKFIFISIPKNATTAIRYGLRRWADVKSIGDRESYFYHHVNGAKMEEYFNQEGLAWNEYYKFAFVRNPFSRIVSQYFYALKCADNQKIKLSSPDYYKNCLKVKAGAQSFKDFLIKGDFQGMHGLDQLKWLTEDFNFVGKVENFPDDYKHACREIGIKYQPLLIQNTSKHKHYTEYYDDETIDFAHNKFKASIERFNYKFGE